MTLPSKPQTRAGMAPRHARVLLGASAKVGKTSCLAEWAPDTTLIVDTQHGTELLEGEHYVVHVKDWPGFVRVVDDVCMGGHRFHTIGLDLVNDLWRFSDTHHGKNGAPASAIEDYGRSPARARAAFTGQIGRLLAAPVGIWFLTHLLEKTNKTGELVVYKPDLNKDVYAYIAGAVDFLWLAEAENGRRRIVHTQPTPHFEAGSRVPLPSPLPMNAAELARAMDRALNPQNYDENGERKAAEPEPGEVAASEAPAEPQELVVKDTLVDPEKSDVPAENVWWAGIEPRLKAAGLSGKSLRDALEACGVSVPEKPASWRVLICGLEGVERERFEALLTRVEEQRVDVPWADGDAPQTALETPA